MKNQECISRVKDIAQLLGRTSNYQSDSYVFTILNSIKENIPKDIELKIEVEEKKYVFVIDEINRGELSKIFGELFFSIDPDYRGEKGSVTTQYSNLHKDYPDFNYKFFVPSNVYIIGTMNDIDRSVDTFDFAMRRRFTFEEITADDSQVMLSNPDVIELMNRINNKLISEEIGLTDDYKIGGSYFMALDEGKINKSELWNNKLKPLFKDYFRGERNNDNKLRILESAYTGEKNDDSING
jgi:5-methylcytosine-specific restriction endonuclease McrBC GTP-binding regulatory subunit McrB